LQMLGHTLETSPNLQAVLALKPMTNFERYGTVELGDDHTIISFKEKQWTASGLINGGVYCIRKTLFDSTPKNAFSLEQEILEPLSKTQQLHGYPFESYFIDIGIPTDYAQAQLDFKTLGYPL
jgi:D-glycero-alpha-D-manno-heptose 1-phosphate guanylyltransferase